MPTLPETADIAELGGVLENYAPVEDPTTDLDADADNKNRACTAMMTHTALRALRAFVGNASTPTDPVTGLVHDAVWGASSAVKPPVVVSATGVYDVTWPTSVDDELDVSHSVVLRGGFAQVAGSTPYFAQVEITAANVARVRIFNSSGVANAAAGATITLAVF